MLQGRYNFQLIKTFATIRVNSSTASKLKTNEPRTTDAKSIKPPVPPALKKEDQRSNHMKSQTHIIDQIQLQKAKLYQNGINFRPPPEDYITRIQERYLKPGPNESEVMSVSPNVRKRKVVEVKKVKNKKSKYRREYPPLRSFTTKSPYWAQDTTPRSYIVY